ncbi:hypothetical protein HOLleu_33397 [Holothuria leucospilota]|uniref:Uncharacterized protein n=1 Tax=Holothuria leucospilota TaxID=206669 RepID=A0A9Q0YNI8_HOLLE|nr:hypothetical protein HOLleu_33397 [Holothuria leucospilota]
MCTVLAVVQYVCMCMYTDIICEKRKYQDQRECPVWSAFAAAVVTSMKKTQSHPLHAVQLSGSSGVLLKVLRCSFHTGEGPRLPLLYSVCYCTVDE